MISCVDTPILKYRQPTPTFEVFYNPQLHDFLLNFFLLSSVYKTLQLDYSYFESTATQLCYLFS